MAFLAPWWHFWHHGGIFGTMVPVDGAYRWCLRKVRWWYNYYRWWYRWWHCLAPSIPKFLRSRVVAETPRKRGVVPWRRTQRYLAGLSRNFSVGFSSWFDTNQLLKQVIWLLISFCLSILFFYGAQACLFMVSSKSFFKYKKLHFWPAKTAVVLLVGTSSVSTETPNS